MNKLRLGCMLILMVVGLLLCPQAISKEIEQEACFYLKCLAYSGKP